MKQFVDLDPGLTIEAEFFDENGLIYNGSDFEVFNSGNLASYRNTAAETTVGQSGRYGVVVPFTRVGSFSIRYKERTGGSPDVNDTYKGTKVFTITDNTTTAPTASTGDVVATYKYQIALIDSRMNEILLAPRPNYMVNGVRMDMGDLIEKLRELRSTLLERLNSIPAESFDAMDSRVSLIGRDLASYIGETP